MKCGIVVEQDQVHGRKTQCRASRTLDLLAHGPRPAMAASDYNLNVSIRKLQVRFLL
ncbi:hypothetical protein TWF569_011313 [Orbilia oligospora]|uniref:Uncharacterized protein n=1 Tax=Orbilia oligospora TaxID=2813651 RepID=A0A7C8K0L1_ORBOL|nr:hypothetical protein TWF102_006100 [Orbilia oligospora]KAF3144076.1 hypothetical protein TWF703_009370 [Orbilia oligospora]KAF3154656.1 hypothetical protein TWF569_011313 [Orbilia oligospora]